ncbi:MAG: Ig-like domain-containing protein [Bacteroidales bacterium]|nr:Ig-like domain-containing protein [Bacteroidales bacterium]
MRSSGCYVRPVYAPNHVESVSLDRSNLVLAPNATAPLKATMTPSTALHIPSVTWSSSDNSIATVDWCGYVTAISPGEATVTVTTTDGGKTASCEVTVETPPSLKDFAQEFVKGLDVWAATVGTVESCNKHLIENETAWQNVHFIPIVPNPNCEYLNHLGNQYDPKYTPWVLNVNGHEISSSQAWEIAIRGLMNLVTAEGEAFLSTMDNRNKTYTLQDNGKMNDRMPEASTTNKWGKHPWYEYDEPVTYNGATIETVDVNFMVKVGAWHVVRSFVSNSGNHPLGMVCNFQEFGTGSGTLNLEGYSGFISPMRELLILMRIYKDILDNNIEQNVYTAIKDKAYSFDLYGIQ